MFYLKVTYHTTRCVISRYKPFCRIIITIILVNIEIMIIQTMIFEFENMMYLFSLSLPKNTFNLEL
jgi:hypothetical protein